MSQHICERARQAQSSSRTRVRNDIGSCDLPEMDDQCVTVAIAARRDSAVGTSLWVFGDNNNQGQLHSPSKVISKSPMKRAGQSKSMQSSHRSGEIRSRRITTLSDSSYTLFGRYKRSTDQTASMIFNIKDTIRRTSTLKHSTLTNLYLRKFPLVLESWHSTLCLSQATRFIARSPMPQPPLSTTHNIIPTL
jgi:hypothetical protein